MHKELFRELGWVAERKGNFVGRFNPEWCWERSWNSTQDLNIIVCVIIYLLLREVEYCAFLLQTDWTVFQLIAVRVKNSSFADRLLHIFFIMTRLSEWLRLTRKITQRWDLMALRLSASPKTTSDPPPWPRPSSQVHWLSLVICQTQCTDLITAHSGSADYTLLGSEQASFSNFTWQQINGLWREEKKEHVCVVFSVQKVRKNLKQLKVSYSYLIRKKKILQKLKNAK